LVLKLFFGTKSGQKRDKHAFGDSNPQSKKKMSKNQILLSFKPAQLCRGKEWYVYYHVMHPQKMKFERFRIKINRIQTKRERTKFAEALISEINQRLYSGWNPFYREKRTVQIIPAEVRAVESSIPEVKRKSITIVNGMKKFFAVKELELRPDSVRSYKSYIKTFNDYLIQNDLTEISVLDWNKSLANEYLEHEYISKNLSNKTFNNYRTFYRILWNWFKDQEYAELNPFENIKTKTQGEKNRIVVKSQLREQIKEHLEMNDPQFLRVCMMVFHCLIRPKEIANLKPRDFSLKNQTIFLSGQFTKNKKARVCTIPNVLMPIFADWDFNGAKNDEYIFGTDFKPGHTPVCARRFAKKWDKVREALKLGPEIKLYSLRDSGIIQMLNDGISPEEVMKQADHYSLDQTTIYAKHANPEGSIQIKSRSSEF